MPIPPQFLKHDNAAKAGKGKKVTKKKGKVDTHSPKPDGSKLTSPFDKDGKGYNPKNDPSVHGGKPAFLKANAQKGKF